MQARAFALSCLIGFLVMPLIVGLQPMGASSDGNWQTELVDGAGDVGGGSSLSFDASGHPHVAYHDYANTDLKYAYFDGTVWQTETVHSDGYTGSEPSLAVDGLGIPHIAWTYYTPSYSLMYASRDDSPWDIANVSPGAWPKWSSLALDSNGLPHISYFTDVDGGANANSLMYAHHDGTSWQIERVDGPSLLGIPTCLDLDSLDRPHIVYTPFSSKVVKHAWYDGTWHIETVYDDGQINGSLSMALDSSGHPHIAQIDLSRNLLWYFWSDGSSWHNETLGSTAGGRTSLKVDSLDRVHIAYTDDLGVDEYVMYAHQDGSGWNVEAAVRGKGPSLALDAANVPHITYYNDAAGELWYAWRTGEPHPPAMSVGRIKMSYRERERGGYIVGSLMPVRDEYAQAVGDAWISVQWILPDGSREDQGALTDEAGRVPFALKARQTGVFVICVTEVTKEEWDYDPSQNEDTCEGIFVP